MALLAPGWLSASASPVIAVVASQPGAAGLGQSATPLLSPGSWLPHF